MKAFEGSIGRVFVLRLEDEDVIPESIENFALKKGIKTGFVGLIGCIKRGDIASGPKEVPGKKPEVFTVPLVGVHETMAVGFIAPNTKGRPVLHVHGALGRAGKTITGCLRNGVDVWHYSEVILYEITGIEAERVLDQETGFEFLDIRPSCED